MKFSKRIIKYLVIIAFIYLIVMLVLLSNVWSPNTSKVKNVSNYKEYTTEQAEEKLMNTYFNNISSLILSANSPALYNLLSKEYIQKNNFTAQSFNKYMQDNLFYLSRSITLNGYEVININGNRVYAIKMNIGSTYKVINVIEEYPFKYSIDFESDYSKYVNGVLNAGDIAKYTSNGIYFEVINTKKNISSIEYKVTITNNDNNNVNIDFLDITTIEAKILNSTIPYTVSNIGVSSTNSDNLIKGSSITKSFVFDIGLTNQNDIIYINFNNIDIDGKIVNISVPI
ncbi:MAG: hypothetical protein N2749_02450 [Clostridia bacterium]|nr:hypothetical protein [Clostridia bacterium]